MELTETTLVSTLVHPVAFQGFHIRLKKDLNHLKKKKLAYDFQLLSIISVHKCDIKKQIILERAIVNLPSHSPELWLLF